MISNSFKLQIALVNVLLLSLGCAAVSFAQDSKSSSAPLVNRSKDTHVLEDPRFAQTPEGESATKTVEKAADRQIQNSIRVDTSEPPAPNSGTVMVKTKQKTDASNESTNVGRDNPSDACQVPTDAQVRRPTVAIALGGGGARGTAHIGVLRVLKEAGIPIDYIVGNSMGSIVGGLYAAGLPLDDIQKIMVDGSLRKAYIPGMIPPQILRSPIEKLLHPLRKHYAGIWTGKKFAKFLEKEIPSKIVNVEDTPIPFSAVATNLLDGKAYRISNGKLSTAIRASSTLPTLLQPVAIGDKVYIDGGVRANLPASAARDTGADIVIAILVDEPLRKLPAKKFQHLGGIMERLGDVMLAAADERQLPFADVIITPDVSGLPVINARPSDALKAINAGEMAARKALPEIEKRLHAALKRKAVATAPPSNEAK